MKNAILFVGSTLLLLACTKGTKAVYPAGSYAASFIPANQDSVLFYPVTTDTLPPKDSAYLFYVNYHSQNIGDEVKLETITQKATSSTGNLNVFYTLTSGIPQGNIGSTGPNKTDQLEINSNNYTNTLYISNTTITGTYYYLDSMEVNNTMYYSVFTDSTAIFFTRTDDIILFNNANTWFYKEN